MTENPLGLLQRPEDWGSWEPACRTVHILCNQSKQSGERGAGGRDRQLFPIRGPAGPRDWETKHMAALPSRCSQNPGVHRGGAGGLRPWRGTQGTLRLGTEAVPSEHSDVFRRG